MAKVNTDKISYLPGENVRIEFRLEADELPSFDLTNLNADIDRIEIERNQLVIGTGTEPTRSENVFTIEVTLPGNATPGLHFVARAAFVSPDSFKPAALRFKPALFEVRSRLHQPATLAQINSLEEDLRRKRVRFAERPHLTVYGQANRKKAKSFRVLIFATGTLLHAQQQFDGYRIVPLKGGLTQLPFLQLANSYTACAGLSAIPFTDQTEAEFIKGSPSLVVDYLRVVARDHIDALSYCRDHADLIFLALGRTRGQVPREFAIAAYQLGTDQMWHLFHAPWYRGNLISDLNPSETASAIERMLPRLRSDPFARLISRSYVEARAEETLDFRLLRLWTILELASDRHVPPSKSPLKHLDGTPILKASGHPETNESQVGRVYSYLRQLGPFASMSTYNDKDGQHVVIEAGDTSHPGYAPGAEVYSLWQMVKAGYAIRNYVAHEGCFDPAIAASGDPHQQLAAKSLTTGRPNVIRFIEHATERVLWREA